jgi:hypothetical protein
MKYRVNLDEISSTIFQSDIVNRFIEAVWAVWAMEDQQIRAALDQHWACSSTCSCSQHSCSQQLTEGTKTTR